MNQASNNAGIQATQSKDGVIGHPAPVRPSYEQLAAENQKLIGIISRATPHPDDSVAVSEIFLQQPQQFVQAQG